ncbi:MAG: tetratricopeptide repeat protein, partial [Planctomycetes bacterium]|nr:tetratricopeptide repeat protein [Planctomycetota bacterium]
PASAARTRGRRVGALLGALLAGGLLLGGWLSQQRTPGLDPSPAAERDPLDQPFRLLNDEGLDPAELLARARERLATDPLDLAARVAEAAALQGLDDYDAAAALAESVLEERPEHLGALQVLAGCSYRLGRHPQATAACERALGVDPRSEFALVYLSLLASARGEPAAGVDFAERALAAHAQSGGAYGARGVARMNLGQVADALADFDASLKTGEVQDIRFNHACALMHLGREAEAIEDLERVQGPLRDSVEWRATRIQCLLELDPQQAEREARALVAERSERPDATYLLADALRRQGEPEAKSWFQRVIELDSASQWGRAAARKLSGAR